jgi:ankyrin repeat protein
MADINSDPVFQAILSDSISNLNNAILNGGSVNVATVDNVTPLDFAIITNKFMFVAPLLKYINILIPSDKNRIINAGMMTLFKFIDRELNINLNEDLSDEINAMNALFNSGANANNVDEEKKSLLHYGVKFDNVDIVTKLLSCGANVDYVNPYDNLTPLFYCFIYNKFKCYTQLLNACNNICVQDKSGRSMLHFSIYYDESITLSLINKDSAIVNLVDNQNKNVLHYSLENNKPESFIELLLSHSINVNVQDINGNIPLHLAILNNRDKSCNCLIKKLVVAGSNLYIKNVQGKMPIELQYIDRALISELC